MRVFMLCPLIGLLLSVSLASQEVGWHRFELARGVRLAVLHVPEAPRQTMFTLLPLGLSTDGAGQTQFSHLAEHMLIRATDPDSLYADGIEINGETTAGALRLDTYAEPEKWRAALARHVEWLGVRTFDAAVLAREKERIAGEEEATVPRGYSHKWATAAWNQIVNHGAAHAAVHGDVAAAKLEELGDYVRQHVGIDARVCIFAAGPVEPKAIRGALDTMLEEVEVGESVPVAGVAPAAAATPATLSSEREATWDLAARHYLEWYPLDGDQPVDRAAAEVLARALLMQLHGQSGLRDLGVIALVSADHIAAGRRQLTFSASLPEGVEVASVRRAFAAAVDRVRESRFRVAPMLITQLAAQFEAVPDFPALRRQLVASGRAANAEKIEGGVALQAAYQELRLGVPFPDVPATYRAVEIQRLRRLMGDCVTAERRQSLCLTPAR